MRDTLGGQRELEAEYLCADSGPVLTEVRREFPCQAAAEECLDLLFQQAYLPDTPEAAALTLEHRINC